MFKTSKQVVVFVFIDGQKVLTEKRKIRGFSAVQYLIPGGTAKKEEADNLELTLQRELAEELGIQPVEFVAVPTSENIPGLGNVILRPYLIKKWLGELPNTILDSGETLVWADIEEISQTAIEPTRKVIESVRLFLKSV